LKKIAKSFEGFGGCRPNRNNLIKFLERPQI
jgi:hypothetical protein